MPVFFLPFSCNVQDQTVTISGPLFHHLCKSRRIQLGESIQFNDASGARISAKVSQITRDSLRAAILERAERPTPSTPKIVLGQAVLKGDRMNWVIQKATELGVSSIIPLVSARTIVTPKSERKYEQRERWQRIALEAAQQAERWDVPEVTGPYSFKEFLEFSQTAFLRCLLAARIKNPGLHLLGLGLPTSTQEQIVLAIGPEGGWTDKELLLANEKQFLACSLGKNILRSETAAIAALSILQNRMDAEHSLP